MRGFLGSVVLIASIAHAETNADKAKQHFATAQRMFEAQLYDKAAEEIQAAYVLDPKPDYLYALGQAFRLGGNCAKAITAYERYLKTKPKDAEKATTQIDRCKADLAAQKPVEPPPPPPQPIAPPPPPVEKPRVATTPPFYADVLGDALVGGGLLLGVVGFVEYRSAVSDLDKADTAMTLDARRDLEDKAHGKRTLAIAITAGGVGLVGLGVARFVLHDRKPRDRVVTLAPTGGGAMVVWGDRW